MRIPLPAFLDSPSSRSAAGWTVLRCVLVGIIAAHGWARLLGGAVLPFGTWLTGLGFPGGLGIAAAVTALEIVGTPFLLARRLVLPLCLAYAAIYAVGIVLVHAKAGWFVVGLGRNGAEFSVLLIACLLCVGLQHASARREP
jgi:putative oxidoreductase